MGQQLLQTDIPGKAAGSSPSGSGIEDEGDGGPARGFIAAFGSAYAAIAGLVLTGLEKIADSQAEKHARKLSPSSGKKKSIRRDLVAGRYP
jgi:hypothetical protein